MATSVRSGILLSVLFLSSFLCSLCQAQGVPSSTHTVKDPSGGNLTISINVPEDNDADDLFFSLSGPASRNWLAFGFGTGMPGSLMILAYRDEAGSNVTLSPRLATGYTMPQLYDATTVEVLNGSRVTGDGFIVNGRCQSCRTWDGGSINITDTKQSMIYAIGDKGDSVSTNDASATIRQHELMGKFAMNLKAATGTGGVPTAETGDVSTNAPTNGTDNTTTIGEATSTRRVSSPIHALLMAGSFVFGYPLGVIFLRVLNRVWMHWLMNTLTTFTVIVGAALGIYISVKYEKHPKLDSAHQGLGLAIVILVLIQLTLGFVHHHIFKKTGTSPTIYGTIHRFAGPAVIFSGIVNGAIGFNFAGRRGYTVVYSLLVLIMALGIGGILFFKRRRQTKKEATTSVAAQNFRDPGIPLQSYDHYGGWPPAQQVQRPGH